MNPKAQKAVSKVKEVGFTATGAVVGAAAGGPIGLAIGAGLGGAVDWWRSRKKGQLILPPETPPGMYQPQTLDTIVHLKKIRVAHAKAVAASNSATTAAEKARAEAAKKKAEEDIKKLQQTAQQLANQKAAASSDPFASLTASASFHVGS